MSAAFAPNDRFALVMTTVTGNERRVASTRYGLSLDQLLYQLMKYQAQPRAVGADHWESLPTEGCLTIYELHAFRGEYGHLEADQMRAIDEMIANGYCVF